jgi:pimeloyl-ACP methyl ester carboxylesterase
MADVFLSYASEDRERVRPLVEALETAGFTVWWDRRLDLGTSFDREIEQNLALASCVMVVWSTNSVESDWVREEADDGLNRGVLVPVQIDECQLPLGFRRTQAAQLTGWPTINQDLAEVIARVGELVGQTPMPLPPKPKRRWRILASVILGLLTIVALGLGYYFKEVTRIPQMVSDPERFFGEPIEQEVRFTRSSDGTRIAYAISGKGPPIVHVLTMFSNLENGLNSPIYDEEGAIRLSSRNNLLVRYDGRGLGLSDRNVQDWSFTARVKDLEAVVGALGLERFGLLASSSGGATAIAYAAQHPERVTRLVLAGCFASVEQDPEAIEFFLELLSNFWDDPFPIGSDALARMMVGPEVGDDYRLYFAEMLRRSIDASGLVALMRANTQFDVTEEAKQIAVPTLVIQARNDLTVPVDSGRKLAALVPGAKLELVDGGHHEGTAFARETRQRALDFLNAGK